MSYELNIIVCNLWNIYALSSVILQYHLNPIIFLMSHKYVSVLCIFCQAI